MYLVNNVLENQIRAVPLLPVPKVIFIPTYYVPELSSMESNC